MEDSPDIALLNGEIVTLDSKNTIAQAVAIKSGRIALVGKNDEAKAIVGRTSRIIDLKGKTVLPGLIDCHVHLNDAGTTMAKLVDFSDPPANTHEEFLKRLRTVSQTTPRGQWIEGKKVPFLAYHLWSQKGMETLSRYDLDAITSDHPIIVVGPGNHVGLANSLALKLAGITKDTRDPVGGKIIRDPATGEPTGILIQKGLGALDRRQRGSVLPRFTPEDYCKAIEIATKKLATWGVTTVHDVVVNPDEIRGYQLALARGKLSTRAHLLIRGSWGEIPGTNNPRYGESYIDYNSVLNLGLMNEFGNDMLKIGGMKISVDGPGGVIRVPLDELTDQVTKAHKNGLRVCLHAIQSEAQAMAIEAIKSALREAPRKNHRHRIEHFGNEAVKQTDISELRNNGIVASPQPPFMYIEHTIATGTAEGLRGPYAFKSLIDSGVTVIGSSDWPVIDSNPLLGIYAAVTRQTVQGKTLAPEERISPLDAIKMYTANAAFAGFEEDIKGSIEVGKLADLTVLSSNPLQVEPERLKDIEVDLTILGGRITYSRGLT